MKNLFLGIALVLLAASLYTFLTRAEERTRHPVLVWTTGICPERYAQLELFRVWMRKNGHVDADGELLFDVKPEVADNQSTLIQAVSGVAGDIIDFVPVSRYAPMGVLEDITEFTRARNMDAAHNYPNTASLLEWRGRQYAYPCNLVVWSLWQNLDTFAKYGMEPPPTEWTPEEFERIGLEFTRRANAGKTRQDVFFCAPATGQMMIALARSRGVDLYNETLTASELRRPEFVDTLKLMHKWTYVDHLLPTAAEVASELSTGSVSANEASGQLISGRYAMISIGRYVNMDLRPRKAAPIRLANSLFPQYGFKNMLVAARASAVYKGSRHKEEAKLFLEFLSSREYNELIAASSDGLPPNPAFVEADPALLAPAEWKNEGKTHLNELRWGRELALPPPQSPYDLLQRDMLSYAYEKFVGGLATAEAALTEAAAMVDREIHNTAESSDMLRREYAEAVKLQKKIDAYKKEGKKIPAEWIANPFHLVYYRQKEMLMEKYASPSETTTARNDR